MSTLEYLAVCAATFLIGLAMMAWPRFQRWRKNRGLHISAEKMRRFNMAGFRGTKASERKR